MDKLTPEFWLQLIIALGSIGAVYTGIRSDLRVMQERIHATRERLDEHLAEHGYPPRRRVGDDHAEESPWT